MIKLNKLKYLLFKKLLIHILKIVISLDKLVLKHKPRSARSVISKDRSLNVVPIILVVLKVVV